MQLSGRQWSVHTSVLIPVQYWLVYLKSGWKVFMPPDVQRCFLFVCHLDPVLIYFKYIYLNIV